MTAVRGHLTSLDFPQQYRKWYACAPVDLYEAPMVKSTSQVKELNNNNHNIKARHITSTRYY